jgi:DNA-binding LytR/AlgR family response regulator
MNCIIVDDEETSRVILSQLCSVSEDLVLVEEFPNALEAIKFLNKNEIDLIFLDIHMPDFSGFDLIQTLKTPPRIILTTSDKNFALAAFEYNCIVDYLVKPVSLPRFVKAVEKARSFYPVQPSAEKKQAVQEPAHSFYINIDRRLIKIETSSVNFIEAKGDYILIKTVQKEYKVHTTLKNIADKLPGDLFFNVHRSYIINLSKIIDIEDNSVLIEKNVIPISRSKKPELMQRLNLL